MSADQLEKYENIEVFHCGWNKIRTLKGGVFRNNAKLRTIDVRRNYIAQIEKETFTGEYGGTFWWKRWSEQSSLRRRKLAAAQVYFAELVYTWAMNGKDHQVTKAVATNRYCHINEYSRGKGRGCIITML